MIPVFLDKTVFPGISADLVSIHFEYKGDVAEQSEAIIDDIVLRVATKLDGL